MDVARLVDWSTVDHLLLDMDGTLLDLGFDNHFWQEYVPRLWGYARGLSYEQALTELVPRFQAHEGKLNWYCLDFWAEELELDIHALKAERGAHVTYLPDVEPFLEQVRARVEHVVLVTNAHQGALAVKLPQTGLDRYLDRIHTAHDFGHPKEDQAFWRRLEAEEGLDPARSLFVDDSIPVLDAAREYGIGRLFTIRRPDTGQPPRADVGGYRALSSLLELL